MSDITPIQVVLSLLVSLDKVERHNEAHLRYFRDPRILDRRQDLAWEIWERVQDLEAQGATDLDPYTQSMLARLHHLTEKGNGEMLEVQWSDESWGEISEWIEQQEWLQDVIPLPDRRCDEAVEAECADDLGFSSSWEREEIGDAIESVAFRHFIAASGLAELDTLDDQCYHDWDCTIEKSRLLVHEVDEFALVWLHDEPEVPEPDEGNLPLGDSRHGKSRTYALGLCVCALCHNAFQNAEIDARRLMVDRRVHRALRAFCAHGTLPDGWDEPQP